MKKNKGITMIALVLTIMILLILASISIGTGNNVIQQSKIENLKTNMLLIRAKGKEYVEKANFELGTDIDKVEETEKSKRVTTAKGELKGQEIKDGSIFEGNLNITAEKINDDNAQFIYYYKITTQDLINIGIVNVDSDQKNGWYIIKYNLKNATVEVYNTLGVKSGETQYYSLSDIQNL